VVAFRGGDVERLPGADGAHPESPKLLECFLLGELVHLLEHALVLVPLQEVANRLPVPTGSSGNLGLGEPSSAAM
jgi:hypothetical protein